MIDSIAIIEFKMTLFIVTVAEEMETIVGFGVEFLEAVRRYDCSIGFIAEVYWYKELFSSATLPASTIRSDHDSASPYCCFTGHNRRRALSRLPLSGQLFSGSNRC